MAENRNPYRVACEMRGPHPFSKYISRGRREEKALKALESRQQCWNCRLCDKCERFERIKIADGRPHHAREDFDEEKETARKVKKKAEEICDLHRLTGEKREHELNKIIERCAEERKLRKRHWELKTLEKEDLEPERWEEEILEEECRRNKL